MTTNEFIAKQHEKLEILKSGKAIAIAAQDTHVKMVERIFEEGKEAGGEKNKYNSTDPLYVNPNNSPKKFPLVGKGLDKNGKQTSSKVTVFDISTRKSKRVAVTAGNNERQTSYFASYKAFREKIGRETAFINLQLFGVLRNDFGKGVVKLSNESYVSTVTNEENKKKVDRFADYFKLNKNERVNFKEVLEFETMKILK